MPSAAGMARHVQYAAHWHILQQGPIPKALLLCCITTLLQLPMLQTLSINVASLACSFAFLQNAGLWEHPFSTLTCLELGTDQHGLT